MFKSKYAKILTISSILVMFSVMLVAAPANAFLTNIVSYFNTSDTRITGTAVGDVNGDGLNEIVTVGVFNDGIRWNAELTIRNSATMAIISDVRWFITSDTQVSSVAIGDVNGVAGNEIVTGGSYFDGTRWNAQLVVWNPLTMAVIGYRSWFITSDNSISSVAIGNVTGAAINQIVTGGSYWDGTRWNAQLVVWTAATMGVIGYQAWCVGSNNTLSSVAIGNVTGAAINQIVTGGSYFDGTRWNAQLVVWNGVTMGVTGYFPWFITSDTLINSVAIGNVTGGASNQVVTGGSYFDGTRLNAQLVVFNWMPSMSIVGYQAWFTTSNTQINSVAIGNYSQPAALDIFTVGTNNDGTRDNAQFIDWRGATLVQASNISWFTTSNTEITSVASGIVGGLNRIFTGGSYFDSLRQNAQLIVWT